MTHKTAPKAAPKTAPAKGQGVGHRIATELASSVWDEARAAAAALDADGSMVEADTARHVSDASTSGRLRGFSRALNLFTTATRNPELPVQTMQFFLYVATRHPTEVPYGELEQHLNMTQASTSRNAAYLSRGVPPRAPAPGSKAKPKERKGYDLLDIYEDPYYLKRKLCKLTPKGLALAHALADNLR